MQRSIGSLHSFTHALGEFLWIQQPNNSGAQSSNLSLFQTKLHKSKLASSHALAWLILRYGSKETHDICDQNTHAQAVGK